MHNTPRLDPRSRPGSRIRSIQFHAKATSFAQCIPCRSKCLRYMVTIILIEARWWHVRVISAVSVPQIVAVLPIIVDLRSSAALSSVAHSCPIFAPAFQPQQQVTQAAEDAFSSATLADTAEKWCMARRWTKHAQAHDEHMHQVQATSF